MLKKNLQKSWHNYASHHDDADAALVNNLSGENFCPPQFTLGHT